jgi:ABC-2 type transport system ATP-binding protein
MGYKAIEVDNLEKRYGDTIAVDRVSFEVGRAEIFGLLGPNGAGKTTTVECLLGLREADGGRIRLLGKACSANDRSILSRIGVQLQTTGMFQQLKVWEQVSMFAGLYPRSLPVETVLEQVGLLEQARRPTKSLSGGQKQRLALALALINDPELIFLDEPTTGLDPQARRQLWTVIEGLRAAGKSVLLTTHYMEEAEHLCNFVAIMDQGRTLELEPPTSLINKYFKDTAIEFGGSSEFASESLNQLPGVSQILFENGRVTLYSRDVPHTMSALFNLAGTKGLSLKDMTVRQASLEDVFLKLTGRRIRG